MTEQVELHVGYIDTPYVEPKRPREYWIDDNGIAHDNPYQQSPTLQSPSMVHVREVIEADEQ